MTKTRKGVLSSLFLMGLIWPQIILQFTYSILNLFRHCCFISHGRHGLSILALCHKIYSCDYSEWSKKSKKQSLRSGKAVDAIHDFYFVEMDCFAPNAYAQGKNEINFYGLGYKKKLSAITHNALFLFVPITLFFGFAFIMELFALGQGDF